MNTNNLITKQFGSIKCVCVCVCVCVYTFNYFVYFVLIMVFNTFSFVHFSSLAGLINLALYITHIVGSLTNCICNSLWI